MLAPANNKFSESLSPHSMGLQNNMTIPSPGFDSMENLSRDKLWSGVSPQTGMGGLTFDGTGLLGTGIFSGDPSTWGVSEVVVGIIGAYAVYSMISQTKQTHIRAQGAVHRTRKSRAARLRQKAKALESRELGSYNIF